MQKGVTCLVLLGIKWMDMGEEELLQKPRREEVDKSEKDMAMELLDEDIRLWSAGKETNIRLLLSTLHHILWPNSGWNAIALSSLMESSQVKKAYQKARLCLHPDKLQQRGDFKPDNFTFPYVIKAYGGILNVRL
ncbi:hypothetical protein SADUNF_Sadunf11G0050900 [Salix dunnii]|uniref:J domain-containing protein n=1 Tax=Salix dunnii TaxID=1413687 RepID=A0A835JN74_9ROSI|nr:hypothetical protein SADUNF_Sadunf11G0050900 [Salix dunnii]